MGYVNCYVGEWLQPVEDLPFPCNAKRLKVFKSDLLDYHSIMDALKGCSGLFYCFEPPSDHPFYDVCFSLYGPCY